MGTRKPAPAEIRTSPTETVKSLGRPRRVGSSESERCVLAMQMGRAPYPSASAWAIWASARFE